VNQVGSKLDGYTDPKKASFSDVPVGSFSFDDVEKSVWLDLIKPSYSFHPAQPALKCWAEQVINHMKALPRFYVILFSRYAGQMGSTSGPVTVVRYQFYGTDNAHHFAGKLRVVNNLSGDFSVPQATALLEGIGLRMKQNSGSYSSAVQPFDNGVADFSVDYWHSSDPGEILLQADPKQGQSGNLWIGIDPKSLTIRRGAVEEPSAPPISIN